MRKLITQADHDDGVTDPAVLVLRRSAQTASTGSQKHSQVRRNLPEAPVGHRQPRADQVPSEKNLSDPNDPVNREDAALDKKIKSICRGC